MQLKIEGGLLFKEDECVGHIYKPTGEPYYEVEISGRRMEMPFTTLDTGVELVLYQNRPGDSYLLGPIFTEVSGPKSKPK